MKQPKLIIKKSDLLITPCEAYNDLPEEFDAIEEIRKRGYKRNKIADLKWLITYCPKAQTQEMLNYFISLNPDYDDVSELIRDCEFAQTNEMLECFISLNPSCDEVRWLIRNCEFANTHEMQKYLKSLR
jgi:hypothetical protein